MYAMLLEGVLKEKIWGGDHLSSLNKSVEGKKIGESWEIACHEVGKSRVKNGRYKGLTLCDLMTDASHKIFKEDMNHFPLLVKYIDANDDLSLQVHPDDDYSKLLNQPFGKTEAWYIIEAEEGAEILLGTHDQDMETLKRHIDNHEEIDYVQRIPVKAGDMYFVPSGTIHAIGKGIVLLEIQQNSDTTFRIHDYQRGRELHLEEAKEVINLNTAYGKCEGETIEGMTYNLTKYLDEDAFVIEKIELFNHFDETDNTHDFQLINCVHGLGMIVHDEGYTPFKKGDSILIPASLKNYEIIGYATLIRSYTR